MMTESPKSAEAQSTQVTLPMPFNTALACQLRHAAESGRPGPATELSGSIYAAPEERRHATAQMLVQRNVWVHADVFPDVRVGVSLDLIGQLADSGTGPIDVHLLTVETLPALDLVCRPGIARVTFPFEGVDDHERLAARIRSSGASPWLAISPQTSLQTCAESLTHVDGLLVMLLEPGTRAEADPALLAKVQQASATRPVGVDGGVDEGNLDDVLAAGASYVVIGRRLFAVPEQWRPPPHTGSPSANRAGPVTDNAESMKITEESS